MPGRRKNVILIVENALLREARERNVNLSATLERALREALQQSPRSRWRAENRKEIAAYNEQVQAHGVFADTLRSF